jgi:two-component system sporulation sensor kinase B
LYFFGLGGYTLQLVKDLLLQALLVLFPVFSYQVLLLRRSSQLHQMKLQWKVIGLFCVSSAALCMIFPVSVEESGYTFDLRIISLVISIAYGGLRAAALTLSFIILFSFATNGDPTIIMVLNTILVVILSSLFLRKYKDAHRYTKISYFTALVCIISIIKVLGILYIFISDDILVDPYLLLFILFPLISVLTIWASIHLIENMREKILMEKEIQHAERLNVIGHLAASVAHEIRNPMTVVRGFMQMFNKESFIPADKKTYLTLMIKELDRAEAIINDYLTLAKPRMDISEKIDLAKQIYFVHDIISSYGLLNNVSIVHKVESDLVIKGSKEKLNQVLINLLKNAIEASPQGGEVSIAAYQEDNKVIIKIADNGIGLSEEEVKRLGTPFYSTKEKGTGLGLMVCYGIIEVMDGKIEVHSKKGKGTTFSIQLPCN